MTSARRSHRIVMAVLAVSLLLDAGAIAVVVKRHPRPAPSSTDAGALAAAVEQRASVERENERRWSEVTKLLARRSRALLRRDRVGFLATVDARERAFYRRQAALFDALAAVPLGSWSYEVDPHREVGTDSTYLQRYTEEVWVPEVALRYQLRGFDPEPNVLAQQLTFVHAKSGWLIGSDADFPGVATLQTARELWDFGPVDVVQGLHSMVLGRRGRHALLTQLSRQIERAVPGVTAVWGTDWSQKVVVLVPETAAELGTILSEGNDLSQIAAVAIAQLGGERGHYHAVGNRIVVNPTNFIALGTLGRQIVLRHEITHVASRAMTGPAMPTWLVEGMADYVGYLTSGVSTRVGAKELRDEIHAGRAPSQLPANDDFDGTNEHLSLAYEGAWLACRLIAERTSQATLVRFYRTVGTGQGSADVVLATAFRDVLHTTPASFLQSWRAYIRAQLT